MASSAAENTAGNVPTREESSQRDNKDTYWQVGKTATDCLYILYERGLWTDVMIRCKDQQLDDPDDRLCAHKVILAARSPVFSAMFFGSFGEDRSDIELLEYSNKSVDAFLRYLYHDKIPLDTGIIHEVLKLAHFYQVTGLVEQCAHILAGDITAENACAVLETALLYDVPSLKQSAIDFIDMNAEAVLESDGFLEISRDTLEYLIKGDTLFAEEILIVTQVYRWAVTKLSNSDRTVDQKNVRELLEPIRSCLRFSFLTIDQYLDFEMTGGIHTREECLNTAHSLIKGRKDSSNQSQSKCRVSLMFQIENYGVVGVHWHMSPESTISFDTVQTIALKGLSLYFPAYGIQYKTGNSTHYVPVEGVLPLDIDLVCHQNEFQQTKTLSVENKHVVSVSLDPPLVFKGSEIYTYTLNITVNCPLIPRLHFKTNNLYKMIIPTDMNNSLTVNWDGAFFVKCFVLSRLSGRDSAEGRMQAP